MLIKLIKNKIYKDTVYLFYEYAYSTVYVFDST